MEHLRKEYDSLLVSGRSLSEEEFEQQVDAFLSNKTEQEKDFLRNYIVEKTSGMATDVKNAAEEISMLQQLEGIEKYINMSSLSKKYFGKTKGWLYQRLHGYQVHGKRVSFNQNEKAIFSEALLSLSNNLREVATKIA